MTGDGEWPSSSWGSVWFEGSLEDMAALVGSDDFQRANATLIQDELKFIDPKRSSFFLTEEYILLDK